MATRTIKLVVVGDSGVGKTSLRGQVRGGSPNFRSEKLSRFRYAVHLGALLDGIQSYHWRRFYHQDTSTSSSFRRICDAADLGAHAPIVTRTYLC